MPQANTEDTQLRGLRAIDSLFVNLDHVEGVLGALSDGMLDREEVPYSRNNLFMALDAALKIIQQVRADTRILDEVRQGALN